MLFGGKAFAIIVVALAIFWFLIIAAIIGRDAF